MASEGKHKSFEPFALIILDGWGFTTKSHGNAIALAKTPTIKGIMKKYASTTLQASGSAVGLPKNQIGNSEAGHLNIGAGRIVKQDAVRINDAIRDGTFFKNPAFMSALRHITKYRSRLHLMGLLTGANSGHAIPEHLYACLRFAKEHNVKEVYVHLFTDGRDAPPRSAIEHLHALERVMKRLGVGSIARLIGRDKAMDRVKDWSKTLDAYNALVGGCHRVFSSAMDALLFYYRLNITDEFIPPTCILQKDHDTVHIEDGDAVIFFNLRSDRARQLTKPFVQDNFARLNPVAPRRRATLKNLLFVAMTDFGPDLDHLTTAFPSPDIRDTLPKALETYRQIYIAETTKFAHMTYFFNGGYKDPVNGEERLLIPSKSVARFDSRPEMSTPEITAAVLKFLQKKRYDFFGMNFANADMLAHTGNIEATIKGCEVIDACVKQIVDAVLAKNGACAIVGDHGNAEVMLDPKTHEVDTAHNASAVPFLLVTKRKVRFSRSIATLANVAPTILDYLGLPLPKLMTAKSLLL